MLAWLVVGSAQSPWLSPFYFNHHARSKRRSLLQVLADLLPHAAAELGEATPEGVCVCPKHLWVVYYE